MNKLRSIMVLVLVAGFVAVAPESRADTISASDRGRFRDDGLHVSSIQNTITGGSSLHEFHSFFVFDLSSVGVATTSATLRLELWTYQSPDANETFTVFDYAGDVANLGSSWSIGSATGLAVFADLGSGSAYGTATVSSSDVGSVIEILLSAQAVADLNAAAGGQFALGLAITSLSGINFEHVFFSDLSESRIHQLVLTPIPEPTSMILLGLGALALGAVRRRRDQGRAWIS